MLPGKNAINLGALQAFAVPDRVVVDPSLDRPGSRPSSPGVGWHLVASMAAAATCRSVSMLNSYLAGQRRRASARQQPADRPARLSVPQVPTCPVIMCVGDEPLVHSGHRRRLSARRLPVPDRDQMASTTRSTPRARLSSSPTRRHTHTIIIIIIIIITIIIIRPATAWYCRSGAVSSSRSRLPPAGAWRQRPSGIHLRAGCSAT